MREWVQIGDYVGHPDISPEEAEFWDCVRAIREFYRLQTDVTRSLTLGKCPDHFEGIWTAHVRPSLVESILPKVMGVLLRESKTQEDEKRKLVLRELCSSCDLLADRLNSSATETPVEGSTPAERLDALRAMQDWSYQAAQFLKPKNRSGPFQPS
jgi:hypothetical protein